MASGSSNGAPDTVLSFDASIAGKRVQADGGAETREAASPGRFAVASRESFEGTLTGRRLDQGDPPWRWLEIGDLTEKPIDFEDETVWCEESYIYELDGDG